jgi:hypothetical protein
MSESKTENDQIDFAGRWESDERLFEDGCRFIKRLERARAWRGGIPDSRHAEELIRHFCSKVRRSPDTLVGRLAHGHKLDNAGIVAVIMVLLAYLSDCGSFNMFTIGTLACGLSIPELARFRRHIEDGTAFMRLLEKHDANLFPRPEVIHMGPGNDHVWSRLREEIAALPVREGRE